MNTAVDIAMQPTSLGLPARHIETPHPIRPGYDPSTR